MSFLPSLTNCFVCLAKPPSEPQYFTQMCSHVREGEAKPYGRHKSNPRCPKEYGKGHCRECTLRRYPKQKIRRPRLWPSCTMPRCRRRHHAWGMCATCLTVRERTSRTWLTRSGTPFPW